MARKPQWDDWRCYRCGKPQPAGTGVVRIIEAPIGKLTIRTCDECADKPRLVPEP